MLIHSILLLSENLSPVLRSQNDTSVGVSSAFKEAHTISFELWLKGAQTQNGFRTTLINIDSDKEFGCTTALQLVQIHDDSGSKPIFQFSGRSNNMGYCCQSEYVDTNSLDFDVNDINQFVFSVNSTSISLHINGYYSIFTTRVCYNGVHYFEPPASWSTYPLTLLSYDSIVSTARAYRLSLYY